MDQPGLDSDQSLNQNPRVHSSELHIRLLLQEGCVPALRDSFTVTPASVTDLVPIVTLSSTSFRTVSVSHKRTITSIREHRTDCCTLLQKQHLYRPVTVNMSEPQTHPRRRPYKATTPPPSPLSTHNMQLRKSETFSARRSISSDVCGLDNQSYMPRRSPTSAESLEVLVAGSNVERVTNLLNDINAKLDGHKSSSTSILHDREVLPLPSFLLDNTHMDTTPMDIDSNPSVHKTTRHDHSSDSGLGTSVGGSKYDVDLTSRRSSARESISTSVSSSHAAITRSFSAVGTGEEKHTLGEYACKQIHDHIIKPILAEESLKDFHRLIKDVPRRIGQKNICNLRDLEKTLIFLAPEFSATPASYLAFCERSITLLHATVDRLPEQDQRLPTDRPYTTNYFLDLTQQIRRYAAIMAATREKEEKGENLDEMDYSRDEKITLRGGLSHNGRPAELVREKNGKVIPLSNEVDTGFSSKRALSDDEVDDEGVTRSMARRRKSDKPGDVMHVCRDCKKEFKRPCDLTKHEKTHSRPWKCTEEKCKYFEHGWPTEKERDRHVNDKHNSAPPQYQCYYTPCTYASKRESNCKQHMEKAHGWEYVRSKSNGRKKAPTASSERTPPTPLTPFPGTPFSALTTPVTPLLPSPNVSLLPTFDFYGGFDMTADIRRGSGDTNSSAQTFSSGDSPLEPFFNNAFAATPPDNVATGMYFENNFDNFASSYVPNYQQQQQQPTPASLNTPLDSFDTLALSMNVSTANMLPHLSPTAQPGVTLYSPGMSIDEGFNEGFNDNITAFNKPLGDFTLFSTDYSGQTAMTSGADFFPALNTQELNQFGGQFDNPSLFGDLPDAYDDSINFNLAPNPN